LIQSDDALVLVLTDGKYRNAETVNILIYFLDFSHQLVIAGKIVVCEARTDADALAARLLTVCKCLHGLWSSTHAYDPHASLLLPC
jgi:hypothetical protein